MRDEKNRNPFSSSTILRMVPLPHRGRQRSGAHQLPPKPPAFRGKFQTVASAWPSLRRPCGHPSDRDLPCDQTFCGCKMSRTAGGGILKGGTVGDSLKWRSLGTFLSPWTERCNTNNSINPNLKGHISYQDWYKAYSPAEIFSAGDAF